MDELSSLVAQLIGGDDQQAEAAVPAIAAKGAIAVDALLEVLHEQAGLEPCAVDARWWAVRTLAEIQDERVPGRLAAALGDPDASVRQCASLGLRALAERGQGIPDLVPALASMLADPDPLCATLAGEALTVIGAPAVPALLQALQDDPQEVRLRAVRALALIGDPSSIPALFNALNEDSALMEYWANEGLDRMGIGMMFFKP
jgi:HEAT repeat protein